MGSKLSRPVDRLGLPAQMWEPRDTAEIEDAARGGRLEETPSFDAKRELPATQKKNAELAVDVAAMSTDGGVLLYGVAEDEHGRPTIPQPIELAGAADRIGQIVATSISEVPYIDVREFESADDPSKGYLLIVVPPSARAPHQVTLGGDLRFYGRGAKGNRRLTEGEVARLYQRRQAWEQDREQLLAQVVASTPIAPNQWLGYVHAFARPVTPDPLIWDRAVVSQGGRETLLQSLRIAAEVGGNGRLTHWTRLGADAWRLSSQPDRPERDDLIRDYRAIAINVDGRAEMFDGGAVQVIDPQQGPILGNDGHRVVFEAAIAAQFAAFLAVVGGVYRAAGYLGHVDLGLAVTGLEGAVSLVGLDPRFGLAMPAMGGGSSGYRAERYPRTERLAASELSEPTDVARRMLGPLFEATTGRDDFDPFAS